MTAKKYMQITKTSKATATRDLRILEKMGVLIRMLFFVVVFLLRSQVVPCHLTLL